METGMRTGKKMNRWEREEVLKVPAVIQDLGVKHKGGVIPLY
jgi:hypothetical protein